MWIEKEVHRLDIGYNIWPWPLTSLITLTFEFQVSSSVSEIALSQEWDGQLTWSEKDVSHPFMTMILTSVTMVGLADVPDSDQGEFRRRRAVDISSLTFCFPRMLYYCIIRSFISGNMTYILFFIGIRVEITLQFSAGLKSFPIILKVWNIPETAWRWLGTNKDFVFIMLSTLAKSVAVMRVRVIKSYRNQRMWLLNHTSIPDKSH